jgi:hypothetical protein
MLKKSAGDDDAMLANNPGSFNLNVPALISRILQLVKAFFLLLLGVARYKKEQ